jgi:WD40 repeat protein
MKKICLALLLFPVILARLPAQEAAVFPQLGHRAVVTSTAFSPDGKRIVSGSDDGTTRLWDAASGKEIAQFISFNDGEWITITPEGFYNASLNGDKYLNVRVDNEVFGIDRFREIFYRPDLVELALKAGGEYF